MIFTSQEAGDEDDIFGQDSMCVDEHCALVHSGSIKVSLNPSVCHHVHIQCQTFSALPISLNSFLVHEKFQHQGQFE